MSLSFTSTLLPVLLLTVAFSIPSSLNANVELNCSRLSPNGNDNCCFTLSYDYNFPQNITSLETRLLTNGVFFSGIEFDLASGWQYAVLQQQRRLRWTFQDGTAIPAGEQELFQFCLSGWNPADSIELVVFWRSGNSIAQRDTLRLACHQCWQAEQPTVECQTDSSFLFQFNYLNQSGFPIDVLTVREPSGQDLIVEESISLDTPLANNAMLENLQLQLRPAADGMDEVCFELTPRRLLNDEIAVDCCTANYCVPIPACDRCCTSYEAFEADVNEGFTTTIDCEAGLISLQARALNDCDRVQFTLSNGAGGTIDGNEVFVVGGLEEDTWYEACMTVTRQDRSGTDCFSMATLSVCDSFYYDCQTEDCLFPEQIDLDFDCPPTIDLVCGCDSMTYLNACAAENWAGLALWEEGRRCNDEAVDIITLFAEWIVLPNETQLSWSVGGLVSYRYFLLQRMLPDQDWETIAQLDNMTFAYTDTTPADGLNKYRIVGVLPNGKVVFSNEDLIVETEGVLSQGGGFQCWPNPMRDQVFIQVETKGTAALRIFNTHGHTRYEKPIVAQGQTIAVQLSHLQAGIYIIQLEFVNGVMYRKRLVKT